MGLIFFLLMFGAYQVKWVGELHKVMMLGEDAGIISLDTLAGKPHVYAIGPVEGLNGEITVSIANR